MAPKRRFQSGFRWSPQFGTAVPGQTRLLPCTSPEAGTQCEIDTRWNGGSLQLGPAAVGPAQDGLGQVGFVQFGLMWSGLV